MTALLALARPFLPYLAALLALGGLYAAHKASVAYAHHQGRAEVQAEWDADKAASEAKLKRAQQLATDMALLAAKRLDDIDAAVRRQKEEDRVAFDALANRARDLPARASIRLTDGAVRLWRDAARAANQPAEPAGPSVERAGATPAVPDAAEGQQDGGGAGDTWYSERELGEFGVAAALAYRAAVAKWYAAVQAYDELRTACNSILNPSKEASP